MITYAALLRAVNVGGRSKLPMADLRDMLVEMEYEDVRTLLQSGNAVFTTDESAKEVRERMETELSIRFGLDTRCVIRTGAELDGVLAGHPFRDIADNGSKMVAAFLSEMPPPEVVAAHDPAALDPGRIRVGDGVIYQWCPDGVSEAPNLTQFVERKWGVALTGRNWNTTTKLAAMVNGS
ncbi:DUF1697 domain-containing protein [Actinokineospora auranticolor]|uniref:Uncharacterized protein (DUF1697 family) n=1 Tax=Actinokineospora auranticolor TaxID=155976 RepID=A0A2S6GSH7_9PSEU|nr:DUF1697 domain-containing protein [Actinokineospora auranticolor]PPK68149.1 uncharacterized protein (DUF1697 family) [Actinokineospora auranticolor]